MKGYNHVEDIGQCGVRQTIEHRMEGRSFSENRPTSYRLHATPHDSEHVGRRATNLYDACMPYSALLCKLDRHIFSIKAWRGWQGWKGTLARLWRTCACNAYLEHKMRRRPRIQSSRRGHARDDGRYRRRHVGQAAEYREANPQYAPDAPRAL